MRADQLPAAPDHIADWEDLLVRFEIMPRALRVALEDAPVGAALELLAPLAEREEVANRWLGRLSGGGERPAVPPVQGVEGLYERFVSLRSRSFAMMQRRGLEVWAWTGPLDGHGEVTAYQLLTHLVVEDARTLAALRSRLTVC